MYHGSHNYFTEFDLKHVLEGSGKVKFGYGVYVTSKYSSAAHYSGQKTQSEGENFVYTVAVPSLVDDNYIMFKQPVNAKIVMRTEYVLGEKIPDKVKADGKLFRKYLANTLTGNDDLMGEKAAAEFLDNKIGVDCIVWPYSWRNPSLGTNRAIFNVNKIEIIRIDRVCLDAKNILYKILSSRFSIKQRSIADMSFYSIAPFIEKYYPQYYSIENYPKEQCVTIHKVKEEWGILSNFGRTPIVVNDVEFKSAEQLFQMMKFKDKDVLLDIYNAGNPKMKAKKWEKAYRRSDWGQMIIDAIKLCLQFKYDQSADFREKLKETSNKYIVEDQTTFRKKYADTWGVKLVDDKYVGPNLQGRLLMELRDNGKLTYRLPADALDFVNLLK